MTSFLNLDYWALVLAICATYTVLSFGIQLQFGYAGLLNFGMSGLMLVAPYTMAILVVRYHVDMWLASALGIFASVLVGSIVAIPSARLRQVFLGMATIGLAEILRYTAINLTDFTGGALGSANLLGPLKIATYNEQWLSLRSAVQDGLTPVLGQWVSPNVTTMILFWLLTGFVWIVMVYICSTPWARILRALRENEDAAAAMGKNVLVCKVQAFAIGSALAGLAGVMLAWSLSAFSPNDFDPTLTIQAYLIVFIAGLARMAAVPVGALIFVVVFEGTTFLNGWPFDLMTFGQQAYIRYIVIGLILILVMLFRPQGIFGRRKELVL